MANNKGLSRANKAKKDEFYTSYDDIQAEINAFERAFNGKTILCNCDDPFESNFSKFFIRNFNYLGLKRLICTSYAGSPVVGTDPISLFDDYSEPVISERGYVLDIKNVPMANGRGVTDEDITWLLHQKGIVKRLKGNGDYKSAECLDYLKQADYVVTNPPFSQFREFVKTLMEYKKQFLIIGNQNAITYKEIFPLLKEDRIWLGKPFKGNVGFFKSPYEDIARASQHKEGLIRVSGVVWFTNIDYPRRHEQLILYKHYNPEEYPKYDNYNAINVDKTADIPMDYEGVMGVPITFMTKYSPDQFEIVGETSGRKDFGKEAWPTIIYENAKQHSKGKITTGSKVNTGPELRVDDPKGTYYTADNVPYKLVRLYDRILIRNKKVNKHED